MENETTIELKNPIISPQLVFEQVVEKYQRKVYWHIRKMVVDHDDADDLTQEVFIKIWQNLDKFRGDSELYTWIYRIASNQAINHLNKKKRQYFFSLSSYEQELSNKLEADALISGDEIQLKFQKALLTLPEKQRLVFNLKYYDELKYEQIAEITSTSVGALKASYHLAVKKLEDYFAKH